MIQEYTEAVASATPSWSKSYIYAGSRLLSTITKSGTTEVTEYHHPDRLGTKLITNTATNTQKEQATLPFGTSIDSETSGVSGSGSSGTGAPSNQRFTSYDRSEDTGLDYAVNRTYNSGQSRFTTVDPIGMASASIGDPQSLNLFAYTQNNPVDFIDPSGLLFGGGITSYEVCEPEWVIVTNREGDTVDAYVEFQCVTKYELEKPETIDISEDCLELLNSIGIKERALQLMENPPLVDIDTLFGAPSIITGPESAPIELDFFPFSVATQPGFTRFRSLSALGETVGDTFNRLRGEGRALAYRGDGIDGIYFRGSLGDPRSNVYWLLHEVVHLVFPNSLDEDNTTDLDEYLIDHAGILRDEGQSASEAVSRFFNSECDPIYLEPPIVIGGN